MTSAAILAEATLGDIASITVTFNPDLPLLEAQLRALPQPVRRIVVDNGSTDAGGLARLVAAMPGTTLVPLGRNLGLAAGLNRGLERAAALHPPPLFVLLLDQDSLPLPGSVEALLDGFQRLQAGGARVGSVGPLLLDPATGATHGFHQVRGWRWARVYPRQEDDPVPCANLNGSGTLAPLGLMRELGGLDERLFIDHVDTDWAFRVQAAGSGLWGVPRARFEHAMGARSIRYWLFGWRVWPARSPARHAFLFRNAIWLMRRDYVPTLWKRWAVAKLFLTVLVTLALGPRRWAQLVNMTRGVREGISPLLSSEGHE